LGRHVTNDDGICPHCRVVADYDGTQDPSTRAEHDPAPNGWVALALAEALAAESDPLVHHHVVADFGRLTDDYARAVVDE
jgi:hypothetical protein